jgi:hypothetical protein
MKIEPMPLAPWHWDVSPLNPMDDSSLATRVTDQTKPSILAMGWPIVGVTLAHLLLFWGLQVAWQPRLPPQHLDIAHKATKLNAYLIYTSTVNAEQQTTVVDSSMGLQVREFSNKQNVTLDQPSRKISATAEVNQEQRVADHHQSDREQAPILPEEPSDLLREESSAFASQAKMPERSEHSVSVSQFTQGYFTRQRSDALDSLVVSEANHYTQKGSLSEMDGDMQILELHTPDEFNTAVTLDSHIDPNRIVKQGDTCYRIVKVGTVLNPHAENLGYRFKCGADATQQALKTALEKRLAAMGVKN